jgi:hypothetical protein
MSLKTEERSLILRGEEAQDLYAAQKQMGAGG